jgi:DNA-binding MarR family transcriptional regulator
MSSGASEQSQEEARLSPGSESGSTNIHDELARELRQFTGLAASVFRTAAAKRDLTVTDLHVMEILESSGPSTAGQLADLTGLTTGAITGMLNRLEEANLVRRERDPSDGRRVIVQLASGTHEMHTARPMFDALGSAGDELVSGYTDEQVAFLLGFLTRLNAMCRNELIRLQAAPASEEEIFSAPLADLKRGQLVVSSAISRLTLRASEAMAELYQARFEGPVPEVKVKDGAVTLRYPRRLASLLGGSQRAAEVTLNAAIPWQISIQGGASDITAELRVLKIAGLEIKGGVSSVHLELPAPTGVVPIRLSGGASEIFVRRPAGVAVRAHLRGWASTFVFDDQAFGNMGNNARLQSSDFDPAAPYYDIDVASSASMVTISVGPPEMS